MSTPAQQHVLRQVFSAFDQGDWTIFDRHPGLHETRQHLPHLYAAFPDLHHTIEIELVEGELIGCVSPCVAPIGGHSWGLLQPANG